MSNERDFYYIFCGKNISSIIQKTYELIQKNNNISSGEVCEDKSLGKISYMLLDNEIKISFSSSPKSIYILKQHIFIINEKNVKNNFFIFTKSDLEKVINKYSKRYIFLANGEIINNLNDILKINPSKLILRNIENNEVSLDIFKSLSNKHNISNEKSIIIKNNELIPQDIYSLGIYRDREISLIIKKRNELINEIVNFMNDDEEIIMKIYGVDGIGKSLTFIYLTSLFVDFKIIYFNLKEFYEKKTSEIINIFKSQLINYYIEQKNEFERDDKKEEINNNAFNLYKEDMKYFEEQINYKNKVDFWYLLDIFLEMISKNFHAKALIIIDQYKIENDIENKLTNLENQLIKDLGNIKLLSVSSLNDMRVKGDFIEILKNCSNSSSNKIIVKKLEDNKNKSISITEKKIEDIFKDFSNDDELNDSDFDKIKKFNDEENEGQIKVDKEKDNKKDIDENIYIDKIENYLGNMNVKMNNNNDKRYRIIYINDLISIKNIQGENEIIIKKMEQFNYNPKYYNKYKKNLNLNIKNKSLDEIYDEFLVETFGNIKTKISEFYHNFSKKYNIDLNNRDIGLMLIQLKKLVEEKIELDFDSLIYYLNKFPIKYLKIIKLDDLRKYSFLRLNKEISRSHFRIEYVFPFFKFVINRLLFEYGENRDIKCSDLPPSGIGSYLEKLIRKSFLIDEIFNNFHSRNVWSFTLSSIKKTKLSKKNKKVKKNKKAKKNRDSEEIEEMDEEEDDDRENEKLEKVKKKEKIEEKKEKYDGKVDLEEREEEEEEGEEKSEEGETEEDIKTEKSKDIQIKIDFFNLKQLTYDDKKSNPLINYNYNYYINCHRSNNPFLDSVILIPCSQDNAHEKIFNLLSFQITINKWKIYQLNKYHRATNNAAILMSKIYNITIKDKFFTFVLAKDYDNKKTQEDLDTLGIPFVFFSTIDNCFFFENNKIIDSIDKFLKDEFKISTDKNKKEKNFYYKNRMFKRVEYFLQKKRRREPKFKITKNSFNYLRRKLCDEEGELELEEKTKKIIIEKLNKTEDFKGKKIIIQYAYKLTFFQYDNLFSCNDDLFGICAYKNNIFLIYKKLEYIITSLSDDKNQNNILNDLLNYINMAKNRKKDNYSTSKIPNFQNLLDFYIEKPSEIFVFAIYETKE